jgi:hypothetical protein
LHGSITMQHFIVASDHRFPVVFGGKRRRPYTPVPESMD